MVEWLSTTLGEIVKMGNGRIQTGPFGSQLHAYDYVDAGIPCIMPTNMKSNRIDLTGIAFITKEDAQRLAQHLVREGDIVYSRRGDVTLKALIRKGEAGYFCGTGCLLVRVGKAIDPEFLTYHLSTPTNQDWIVNQAVGAHMPNLNTGILANVPLRVPSLAEQQKIAAVLSALDAKIDLNNRINAELEALAKTIYDYWFVQFDFPDANDRPYKTSGGKMIWNDALKREIPAEWEVGTLGKWLNFKRGISYRGHEISDQGVPLINLNSFHLDGTIKFNGTKHFTGTFREDRRIHPGELVIAITDVTRNADIIGKAFVVPDLFSERPLISCDVAAVSGGKHLTANYLERLFNSSNYHSYIKHFASGTLVLHLDLNGVNWFQTFLPPQAILQKHSMLVESMRAKITANQKQNAELTRLRDWLLPLLMNGQVRVA